MTTTQRLGALVALCGVFTLGLARDESEAPRLRDSDPAEGLLALLQDETTAPKERFSAAVQLGRIRDPRAFGALLVSLRDKDQHVCLGAARGLGLLGDRRAIGPLVAAGHDNGWAKGSSGNRAFEIATALRRIGTPAVGALIGLLEEPEPVLRYRRYHSAWALGEIGDPRAVQPLMSALKTCDTPFCTSCGLGGPFLSSAIISALGRIGQPATEPLLAWLRSQNPVERFWAPPALTGLRLGDMGGLTTVRPARDPRIPGALRAALRDQDARVRFSAARSLCLINDRKGLATLEMEVRRRRLAETAGAMACLVRLTPPEIENVLLDALDKYGDCEAAWVMSEARSPKLRRAGDRHFDRAHCGFYND